MQKSSLKKMFLALFPILFLTGACEDKTYSKSKIFLQCDQKGTCYLYVKGVSIEELGVEYSKMSPRQKKLFQKYITTSSNLLLDYAQSEILKGFKTFVRKAEQNKKELIRRYYQKHR